MATELNLTATSTCCNLIEVDTTTHTIKCVEMELTGCPIDFQGGGALPCGDGWKIQICEQSLDMSFTLLGCLATLLVDGRNGNKAHRVLVEFLPTAIRRRCHDPLSQMLRQKWPEPNAAPKVS